MLSGPSLDARFGTNNVYHYTTRQVAFDYILPFKRLRMGRYLATNDPRENKLWSFGCSYSGGGVGSAIFTTLEKGQEAAEKAQQELRIICCTQDLPTANRNDWRGYGLLRMWAQYGDAHRGICLGFDREKLDEAIRTTAKDRDSVLGGPVTYDKDPNRVTPGQPSAYAMDGNRIDEVGAQRALNEHLETYGRELLFFKSHDWRDEREYRWVCRVADEAELYVDISAALTHMVLGSEFPQGSLLKLKVAAKALGVRVFTLNWQSGNLFCHPLLD